MGHGTIRAIMGQGAIGLTWDKVLQQLMQCMAEMGWEGLCIVKG